MIKHTLSLLLIFGLSFSVQAQGNLSLKEAVARALEQNLSIKVAQQDLLIADKNNNLGNAGFLPQISASGSFSHSQIDQQQQLAVGGEEGALIDQEFNDAVSDNLQAGINASYVLFDGLGRLNNLKRLGLQQDLSGVQLRFTIENVLLSVFNAYYNLAQQEEQMLIAKEAILLSQQRYNRAEIAVELGSNSRIEALSALVDLRRDSVTFLNNKRDYQQGTRQLNLLLNFPVDTLIKVDTVVKLQEGLDYFPLHQSAMQNNAAIVQAQINRNLQKRNLNLAWSDRMPEIGANAGYNYSRQENEGGFLRLSQSTGWQYGLSAQWNIFNSYRSQTAVEVARIAVFQSELATEQARQQLKTDLANAWLSYKHAQQISAMEKRNLVVALLNYQRTREAYQLGQVNNVQLREAQLNYINSKAALNNLEYQAKVAEIDLQRVAGTLMSAP
jgi:outer membrane protein